MVAAAGTIMKFGRWNLEQDRGILSILTNVD